MASGHASRINRPNTWLLRPDLRRTEKVLANAEPSTHGTLWGCSNSDCFEGFICSEATAARSANHVPERSLLQ